MAIRLCGIAFSHDYEELIEYIENEISCGRLCENDVVYVVRGEGRRLTEDFILYPVLDIFKDSDKYTEEEKSRMGRQTVLGVLTEIKQWDSIF